ncbi:hypothetical protein [Streptomyces sp. NPDC057677]|uniref:hypothetical protein n=1 Tax=unclassified Streptomyces TaxID=2593676 RepID=UPI00368EDDBB
MAAAPFNGNSTSSSWWGRTCGRLVATWRGFSRSDKIAAIGVVLATVIGIGVPLLLAAGDDDRKGSAGAVPSAPSTPAEVSRSASEPTPTPSASVSASASDPTPEPTPTATPSASAIVAPSKPARTESFQLARNYGFDLNAVPMRPKAEDEDKEKDVYFNWSGGVSAPRGGQFVLLEQSESPTYENCKSKSSFKKSFSMYKAKNFDVCVYLDNGAVGFIHVGEETDGAYALTVTVWSDPRPAVNRS